MSRRGQFGTRLRVESLEDRRMLAGNVVVEAIGGSLFLRGDNLSNGVNLTAGATPGTFQVAGVTDASTAPTATTLSLGRNHQGLTLNADGTVTASGITRAIFVDMGNGDNAVGIGGGVAALEVGGGTTPLAIPSDMVIQTGSGNDVVTVTDTNVGGSLTMNTGAGHDTVTATTVTVNRDAVINTGAGDDTVALSADTINGALVVNTGTSTGAATTNDIVTLLNVQVARDATLVGAGVTGALPAANIFSELFLVSGCTFKSNFVVSMGRGNDQLLVTTSTAQGSAVLTTQSGGDVVALDNFTVGNSLVLNTGAGDDLILISAGQTQGGFGVKARDLVLSAGAGNDNVTLQASTIAHDLVLDLGIGDDTLEITGNTVNNNAWIFGGLGKNTINSDARTVNTFRRVFFFDFQPMPV